MTPADVATLEPRRRRRAQPIGDTLPGDELHIIDALRTLPDMKGRLEFDEFAQRVGFAGEPPWKRQGESWSDVDTTELAAFLQERKYQVRSRSVVDSAVQVVARDRLVHPVRQFLDACKAVYDGQPRLSRLFGDYFDARADEHYLAATSRAFLIGAVARIMQPGCKVDTVVVFEAPQGAGKSRSVRVLGEPWITESLPALSDQREAAMALRGVWFAEVAELAAMSRSEVEHVKAFISRQVDDIREPYQRHSTRLPRQTILAGTTNDRTYLRDSTGNRRFWPIQCGLIDLELLARDRMQLFGEAVIAYEAGEPWHLSREDERIAADEQEQRRYRTELEVSLLEYLDRQTAAGVYEVDMRDCIRTVCNLDPTDDQRKAGAYGAQLAALMARNGWRPARVTGRGANRRNVWGLVDPPAGAP